MNDQIKTKEELCDKLIEKTTVLLTTIPSRRDVVLHTIDSVYDQVDEIRIVFNGYDHLPSWALRAPKIKGRVDPTNRLSDCAKWLHVPDDGYVFTIDDDILYPDDYIFTMIDKIEQYNREAVATVHGSFFDLPFISYGMSKKSFRFMLGLPMDVLIPMIGTGTLAFHTDTITITADDVKNLLPNRSDIWFSLLCFQQLVSMICIERPKYWLKPLRTNGDTIWNKMQNDKNFLNENTKLIGKLFLPYICANPKLVITEELEKDYVLFNG